ncbi:MAG: MFS transporter [Clostridium sp.]|nr:MFS transporter [Clostridium sp.]MDU7083417.1 MFS transporter [Clostridium sp.]
MKNNATNSKYHRAKWWQLALFPLNNTATNLYMTLMGYISYYLVGFAGIGVVVAGTIMTAMRIWDGVTDPIIGFILDKTNGKFGKNRPFMVLGNITLAVMAIIIFKTTHLVPKKFSLIYFIFVYAIYIVGYTLQCVVTKSAQSCLTNDPSQRPIFALFDGVYNTVLFTVIGYVVMNVWYKQYNGFTLELFDTFLKFTVVLSAFFTILAVIAIWGKDRTEYFGTGEPVKVTFKDYWEVLKHNRAIQMLVVSASSDKLAGTIAQNSIVTVMLYGVVCGDVGIGGQLGMVMMIPNMLIMFFGVGYIARKLGQRKAMIYGSLGGIIFNVALVLLFILGDPTTLSLTNISLFTVLFLTFTILGKGAAGVAGSIVIPMTADCADYETYRSGKYVPGLMGTLFSFVDKIISSFGTTIVSLSIAAIGFTTTQPTADTPYTPAILGISLALMFGLTIFGLVCNVIAMKFYPLTKEKMEEIQEAIAEIKSKKIA